MSVTAAIVAGKTGLGMTVGNDNIYIDGKIGHFI